MRPAVRALLFFAGVAADYAQCPGTLYGDGCKRAHFAKCATEGRYELSDGHTRACVWDVPNGVCTVGGICAAPTPTARPTSAATPGAATAAAPTPRPTPKSTTASRSERVKEDIGGQFLQIAFVSTLVVVAVLVLGQLYLRCRPLKAKLGYRPTDTTSPSGLVGGDWDGHWDDVLYRAEAELGGNPWSPSVRDAETAGLELAAARGPSPGLV